MPGTEPIFEASGRHCRHSPDEEIGRARASSIRRRLRARSLLRRSGCELFTVRGVLRLGRPLGGRCSFSLRRGCTGRSGGGLRLCLYRLRHRAFAHIRTRLSRLEANRFPKNAPMLLEFGAAEARRTCTGFASGEAMAKTLAIVPCENE